MLKLEDSRCLVSSGPKPQYSCCGVESLIRRRAGRDGPRWSLKTITTGTAALGFLLRASTDAGEPPQWMGEAPRSRARRKALQTMPDSRFPSPLGLSVTLYAIAYPDGGPPRIETEFDEVRRRVRRAVKCGGAPPVVSRCPVTLTEAVNVPVIIGTKGGA